MKNLDTRYLAFEDDIVDFTTECIETFAKGDAEAFSRYGELVSKGLLSFMKRERELTYPPDVSGMVLSEDFQENEVACKLLELCVLVRVVEACRESEPRSDRPFDQAQVVWIIMRIYNQLYDVHDIGSYLPDDIRRSITEARARTARHRMKIDP